MTTGASATPAASPAADATRDWDAIRHASEIQFAPVAPPKVPETPGWLKALGEFLRAVFEPVGQMIGLSWPVLQWILLGIGILAVLFVIWRIAEPLLERGRTPAAEAEPGWIPNRDEALALLEDADRLAAEGRFDEATHLLLRRSVQQIAAARPDWVHRASTAREIAAIHSLPDAARSAFAVIAGRVERSLFALRTLDGSDWGAARDAYAAFALERLPDGAAR